MLKFAAFLFSALFAFASVAKSAPAADPSVDSLVDRAVAKKLYLDKTWLRLGHYRADGAKFVSDSLNPKFFVDQNGRFDPRAEMIATLREGFRGDVRPPALKDAPAMSVRCQFPARWKWLSKELGFSSTEYCKEYEEFRAKVNPSSVTLVFSAYYINNPSSLFGHLLFRLNNKGRAGKSAGSELLDFGVNYGANATTNNALLYGLFGMMGLFEGNFAMLPYFYKVREYSDSESRDLWEYELNLSPEELDRFTDHLWEMASTYFNYYYFSQNCAYQLLSILDAAAPRLSLVEKTRFLVIPSDALKIVTKEPGLLKSVHYRASPLRQLMARYEKLSREEKSEFLKVAGEDVPTANNTTSPESQARVLDTVLDYIDYKDMHALIFDKNPEVIKRKQNVLSARAKLPITEDVNVEVKEEERPDLSHPSFRYAFAGGAYTEHTTTYSLVEGEMRFAFHSLYDPLDGFLLNSSLESWRIRVRAYPERKRIDLQEFALVDVRSLSPVSLLSYSPSFHVYLGADHVRDLRCEDCLAGKLIVNGGVAAAPFSNPTLIYLLTGPVGETSPEFNNAKFVASYSARVGTRIKFSKAFQIDAEGEWRRVFDRETFDRLSATERARFDFGKPSEQPWALEAQITQETDTHEILARYLKFF